MATQRAMAVGERLRAAGVPHTDTVRAAVAQALAGEGVAGLRQELKASMTNTRDGEVSSQVACFFRHVPIRFTIQAKVVNGLVVLQPESILPMAENALKSAKDGLVAAPKATVAKLALDVNALAATLVGERIFFKSTQFPEWGHSVQAAVLKAEGGRAKVEADLQASLGNYVAIQANKEADFGALPFKLPVIASIATRKLVPTRPPEWTASAALNAQADNVARKGALSVQAANAGGPSMLSRFRADQSSAETVRLHKLVADQTSSLALNWAKSNLPGDMHRIASADFSGVVEGRTGRRTGSAVYAIKYVAGKFSAEASIQVPFGSDGFPDATHISRTAADVVAAKEKAKELEIVSEEGRKKKLAEWKASQQHTQEVQAAAGLGIQAGFMGVGQNLQNQLPQTAYWRKTAFPEEFSKPGKKLWVGGGLYELCETSWQAQSIQASTHWMLKLIPDGQENQADYCPGSIIADAKGVELPPAAGKQISLASLMGGRR